MSFEHNAPAETFADTECPVGNRIPLTNGATLETPNQKVIEHLMAADSRVRYFATPNPAEAQETTRGMSFYRAVTDHLGAQVAHDFPDTRVAVRGTVAALTEGFPYWDDGSGTGKTEDMHTVLDMLLLGSDSGKDTVRVGEIEPDGSLNVETTEWLRNHFSVLMLELDDDKRDQVFPALLVYKTDAFQAGDFQHGFNALSGPPADRLAALYITDKIV